MSILRPDRMHFLRLVLLKDDLPAVFSLLLKRDVIHIEKASNFFGHESSYTPVQTHSAQADMLALKQNLKVSVKDAHSISDAAEYCLQHFIVEIT